MAWTNYQKILALLMVFTGAFNTISVKYADDQKSVGEDGIRRKFTHPFMQSAFMFLGEILCLLFFKIMYIYLSRKNDGSVDNHPLTKGSRHFNPLVLLIPALCDMLATSIMYIGLTLTWASSFQMLRGSVIVFTGLLSTGFLDRKFGMREWGGILTVILGLIFVSISDVQPNGTPSKDTNSIITGDLLIICAQVITALQMVVEEKFVAGQDIPALQAVGWEGIFGFIGICLAMIPLNYIYAGRPFTNNSRHTLEATMDALIQIGNDSRLFMAIFGIVFSIAFFNFAGISVTKEMNATTRMVLDTVRTLIIWIFSIAYGWQYFNYYQLLGFSILIIGMAFYYNAIIPQLIRKLQSRLGRHRPPRNDEVRVINPVSGENDPEQN